MIKIDIQDNKYSINKQEIVDSIKQTIIQNNGPQDASLSVTIENEKTVFELAKKYLHENDDEAKGHPVLSFLVSEIEGRFILPPDEENYLGEIIVSFEQAQKNALQAGHSLGTEIVNLVNHATLHLLGIHHN